MHDVIVVGGGPAGLYSALLLARQGFQVVVFEEHPGAGDPVHCTGVLAAEAFQEFDVGSDAVLNALVAARFYAPSGLFVRYATPDVEALVIDRRRFDQDLLQQARESGVTVRLGQRITLVEPERHHVTVGDGRRVMVRGRVCILACGASYAIQRRLGMGMPSVFLHSAQLELPAARACDVEVHFGRTVAPNGFAWAVPVVRDGSSYARVGVMCARDAAAHFRRFTARVQPRWGLGDQACDPVAATPRLKILPLAPIDRTYADRVVAVGDAAGLVKATTGGGIYYSLVSAAAAAEVVSDALRRDQVGAGRLARYEKLWRRKLGAELEAQLALRVVAHRLTDAEIEELFELARLDGVMPILRRTARFNRHRALIVSLFQHPSARRVLLRRIAGGRRSHALPLGQL